MSWYCGICKDRFDNLSPISTPLCGHTFHSDCLDRWVKQSKTCPECRQSVTARIVKLYPNFNLNETTRDTSMLENDLSDIRREMRQKNEEVSLLKMKNSELVSRLKIAETETAEFHQRKLDLENEIHNIRLKLNHLAPKAKIADRLKVECEELQTQIQHFKNIKDIVLCDSPKVEEIVKTELDSTNSSNYATTIKHLATYVCTLRRELDIASNKKKTLQTEVLLLKGSSATANRRCQRLKEQCDMYKQQINSLQNRDVSSGSIDDKQVVSNNQVYSSSLSKALDTDVIDSPILVKFGEANKKIDVIVLDDNRPSTSSTISKNNMITMPEFPNRKLKMDIQTESITRSGYDGFGGHRKIVMRTDPKVMRRLTSKK